MIISTDTEAFDKIQYSFVIKTLNILHMEETYLSIIQAMCHKLRVNIHT